MFEGLCRYGNKSTTLLYNSSFRTTPKVSSKLYFVEISEKKLWLFNHKRADFLASKFWNFFSLFSLLKDENLYKYLGVDEDIEYDGRLNKERISKEFLRRARKYGNQNYTYGIKSQHTTRLHCQS